MNTLVYNHAGQGLGEDGLIELLASGRLAGCTALRLYDNQLGDRAAEALAGSEDLVELRLLDLGWNRIGPDGARALASSPVLSQLERLNLYHNDVLDEGARALAASAHLHPRDINLCRNGVGVEGAVALRESPAMRGLRRLHAGCNQLGDEGLAVLAGLAHVEDLNVRMNGVGPRGVEALAARRGGARLRFLGIEDNPLGDLGLLTLARSGLLGAAEVVILISTDITADGLRAAAAYPRQNPGRLRLGLNGLGDRGVDALLSGPAIAGLLELSLPFNDIGPQGAEQLAGSPLIRDLERLDLVGNDIGRAGRAALCASRFLAPGVLRIDEDDATISMAPPGGPDSPGAAANERESS